MFVFEIFFLGLKQLEVFLPGSSKQYFCFLGVLLVFPGNTIVPLNKILQYNIINNPAFICLPCELIISEYSDVYLKICQVDYINLTKKLI